MLQPTDDDSFEEVLTTALTALRKQMLSELTHLDTDKQLEAGNGEQRLKYLSAYLKTLQGIEEMVRRMREKSDNGSAEGIDVVEFRRQLEMQIERLVDSEIASTIPAGAE